MEAHKIELVQTSFSKVVPIADKAAEIFYSKLFEKDPSLKPMFRGDMAEQGKKLMTMIGTAVNGLSNLEAIVPAVQKLGRDHVAYGVQDHHYDTVGAALIETLAAGLGDDFTEETKDAWVETYTLLATTMKTAANEVADNEGLTERKIGLVKSSFAKVAPIAETASDIFYDKLFTINPSLKALFPTEMGEQKKKLMTMLGSAVGLLDDLDKLVPVLQDLGKRHVGYKVEDKHYNDVGQALIETLAAGLGDDFTEEVKEAWVVVYGIIATTMKDAAKQVETTDTTEKTSTPPEKPWWKIW